MGNPDDGVAARGSKEVTVRVADVLLRLAPPLLKKDDLPMLLLRCSCRNETLVISSGKARIYPIDALQLDVDDPPMLSDVLSSIIVGESLAGQEGMLCD